MDEVEYLLDVIVSKVGEALISVQVFLYHLL